MDSENEPTNEPIEAIKKPTSNELIQMYIKEISEMVAFLDYSFERAFTIKEKSYIRAYKDHVTKI
jgi:hypothetical protein